MNKSDNISDNISKDINLDNLYSALVECFSVILCGYVAGRLNLISQRETRGLDVFVRTFSLPAIIFLSLAELDLSSVNWNFLASILLSKSIIFIGVLIVTLLLIRPVHLGKLGLYAVFCTQSNDFALGYPILIALYGNEHPNYPSYVYLLAPISLAILNPIAYILLEIGKFQQEKETQEKLKNVFDGGDESILHEVQGHIGENESQKTSDGASTMGLNKENASEKKNGVKLFGTVFLNIITNPVMLMTLFGICGNFIYHYIKFLGIILKAFANVFSTSALFVLGLRMVGTMHKLKGGALLTPGILIITKLLVLPLVTREIVSLLQPGINPNDTVELSSFGFIYGTFPTAPMVFVLSTQYELEIESMSSSLVVCTFLSAPLMYVSSKMIFMDFIPTNDYVPKLESFQFNIGVIGICLAAWLVILVVVNKSFSKIPHKITGFLIVSQVTLCIGSVLQPLVENHKPLIAYLQLCLFAFGLYSSRLWTWFLAISLVLLHSRSLCFVIKLMPVFICFAWGLPAILVAAVCFSSFPNYPSGSLINPNLHHGMFQSIITLLVLSVSFMGTCVCLILQHRYERRFAKYLVLIREINSTDLQEVNETSVGERLGPCTSHTCIEKTRPKVTDIEEIISENSENVCGGDCENGGGLCSSKFSCSDSQREICEGNIKQYNSETANEDFDEEQQDHQVLRHIVLLLLLITSMFVNLMLSVWTLVVEDAISGVYIELLFLNVTLNTGQICLTFAVFGFDTRGLVATFTNRWRKFYYGADSVILTPVDELGFETTHVCHQFIAHHLRDCENEIGKNKRLRLKLYKDCFKGRTLVAWLQMRHLAKDEAEATQYAFHLLEGRVLRHIENRHHFENSDLLYTFKSQ